MPNILTDDLYLRFRDLVQTRLGLSYPARKRADLEHGLGFVLKQSGCADAAELLAGALAGGPLWEAIVQQLTIGETYFFRNAPQFEALSRHVLPELIRRRAPTRSLRIWSAACATGEEPYSLAMLLAAMLPDRHAWHVAVLATDINQAFLAGAREALYGEWSFRETPAATRARFFAQEGRRWRLRADIRDAVTFARLNLAEDAYPAIASATTALDLIMCRNVMIYFDEATTRRIVERLYQALAPGGWLVVGHAEPNIDIFRRFETHNFPNTVLYRKPLDAPIFPVPAPAAASIPPLPARPPAPVAPAPPARPSPGPPAGSWSAIAGLLGRGDTATAEQRIEELLLADPAHAEALLALARLCADRGDDGRASELANRVIAADPLAIPAHYLLGQLAEQAGDTDAALGAYRRTVFLDHGFVPGLLGMARSWQALGRPAAAARTYRTIVARLASLPPDHAVPGLDATTAGELAAFAADQQNRLIPA